MANWDTLASQALKQELNFILETSLQFLQPKKIGFLIWAQMCAHLKEHFQMCAYLKEHFQNVCTFEQI